MDQDPKKIFKDFSKDDIFVIGTTPEERAKILYIRSGMSPSLIARRLEKWGDQITTKRISKWVDKKGWVKLRKQFKDTYSEAVNVERAKKIAVKDVSDENEVRGVYAEVSGQIINSIKQKLALSVTPDSPFPTLNVQDLASLALSLETTQKVHHRALGIPELIKIDPTTGMEGIRVIPAHEDPALEDPEE